MVVWYRRVPLLSLQVETIGTLLRKYVSVEQKDALHCIKHFTKIRARDPSASQDMLPATIEHLTLIGLVLRLRYSNVFLYKIYLAMFLYCILGRLFFIMF